MRQAMLTTVDNPYDPFDDFDEWDAWDKAAGYHSSSYLARVAFVSFEATEVDQNFAIETAIDEIVEENITGKYQKVVRDVPDPVAPVDQ